jgi:hypothetical protein
MFFYWINNESELVTCTSKKNRMKSDENNFIEIEGMSIVTHRNKSDFCALNKVYWDGMKQGND